MPRLIDADKLIELYNIMADKFDGMGKSIWEQFATTVEWSPTVDAEPVRHGHWIVHYDDIWPEESTWECSICHEEQGEGMLDTNYCPACGAKMDEVEDG